MNIRQHIDHLPGNEPSLRVQTILQLVQEMLADLAVELRKRYSEVDIKLSISAE
ncbi:hypothetical protein [Alicyclobacillus pomorum]|uniref:hypothetical protein n=1 Tax=Alicyclobacillus pomorum TaxID=204470 RepID=UPI0003F821B6|nr:hypothetical protein [Alicyclobacillus pomorum]